MASGAQQPQQSQPQPQQQHHLQQNSDHLMQHQQMQFTSNHPVSANSVNFQHQQQMVQHSSMSPSSGPMIVQHSQGHMISINPQQQHLGSVVGSSMISLDQSNQLASHMHQLQQKSQILPLLLSPRPPSLTPNSSDQLEQPENDHEQIIDQVISLENEYSDTSGTMANSDSNTCLMLGQQQQQQQEQQHMGYINLSGFCLSDSNQFSSSSEDLLNLLLEFDREPSNLIGLGSCQQVDQDEKVGIENIRKQLMSCEVQSDQPQNQNINSVSPALNQMTCQSRQPRTTHQRQQTGNNLHQQQITQQHISQTAPVMSHHQQPHQMSNSSQQQHQPMSTDQTMLNGSYSAVPMNAVPVSSSSQSYATQQQHRISQSSSMSIVSNSPSPSWQQPQLSSYSSQPLHSNPRAPTSQRQGQQHTQVHQQQHQQTATSSQMQQLQPRNSQSVSPPVSAEPSPVVKKNPLLNAQLVNLRAPSITPTRFMNSQPNVLNQNPILNAKLSQSPFTANTGGNPVGSPVNQSLNPQSSFVQQSQQQSSFNFDMATQQQQQNTSQQPREHMNLFGTSEHQQATNHIFRTPTTTGLVSSGVISVGNTSPSGGLSQQVKREIRRKVQQPKQQHQTTSLLKQLLSDDNK